MYSFWQGGLQANRRNLSLLLWLRAIFILVLIATAAIAGHFLRFDGVQRQSLLGLLGILTWVNGLSALRLWYWRGDVSEHEIFGHLACDVIVLGAWLYTSGGPTNPFVSWFLVPVSIAAATLTLRFVVVLLVLSLVTYGWLTFHFTPLVPASMPHAGHMMAMDHGYALHLYGMGINFLASACLIALFVWRMSRTIREQDAMLANQREELMNSEHLVMLGTLAAGAAHELGTPLNTMTILVDELMDETGEHAAVFADLTLLRQQLRLCRQTLQGLRSDALAGPVLQKMTMQEYLSMLLKRVEVLHPQRHYALKIDQECSDGVYEMPALLAPILMNLINNAFEASRNTVQLQMSREADAFVFMVEDDGAGVPSHIVKALGQPLTSSKVGGLGLGLYLSHAALNRLGGSIKLITPPSLGTRVEVRLPTSLLELSDAR